MGRSVLCESFVEEYLKVLSRKAGICMGLLIGQPSAGGKDYVVHATRITGQDEEESDESHKLNATIASQQALDATRMLPGGMYVLGIFVIHPKNVFQDPALLSSIKFILMSIRATFEANPLLMGTCEELEKGEKLVLHYSSDSKVHVCKTVSLAENPSVHPCDWKFVERLTTWHKLNVYFETDDVYPMKQNTNNENQDTEANLTECAKKLREQLADAKILFDAAPKLGGDTVEGVLTLKNQEKFYVNVYLPTTTELSAADAKIEHFEGTLKFDGTVSSQIFVNSRCTFAEAERFIVHDIVRSLMSRIQIHCDSLVQADDTPQDKITLNELPRRIYYPMRKQGNFPVQFSDYLFPEENVETPLGRISDILDIGVSVRDLNSKVELVPVVKEDERPSEHVWRKANVEDDFDGKLNLPVVGGLITFIVLLIALVVYYFMK